MSKGFEVEIDRVDESSWNETVRSFDDASIYQTWSWGAVSRGEKNLSHVVLKEDGRVVAAAQVWIITFPLLNVGIAYVKRGPMWLPNSGGGSIASCRLIVQALVEEYAERRGLLLRIMPNVTGWRDEEMFAVLTDEGMMPGPGRLPYRTFLVDMSHSLDELRMGLKKNWRRNLSNSMKHGLTVEAGGSQELFDIAAGIYREMRARKGFAEHLAIGTVGEVNRRLPESMKMRITVCRHNGRPVSGHIASLVGGTCTDLISGTAAEGRRLNSSYLTHWRVIEWLKSAGCRWYDLGGIEPVHFPGPYSFKSGIANKNARDVVYGQFELSRHYSGRLAARTADGLNIARRAVRELAARLA